MRLLNFFIAAFLLVSTCTETFAQNRLDDWRVSKKVRTDYSGQQFSYEYSYNNEGLIETLKSFSATGILTNTITDFTFDRNKKPTSYTVIYNRERAKATVTLEYDNNLLIKLVKKLSADDVTTYTYRYSSSTLYIIQKPPVLKPVSTSKIYYFDEQGNYRETVTASETGIATSTVTLKKDRNNDLNPYPDNFLGGYKAPEFLGVVAFSTEPRTSVRKDKNGLITEINLTSATGTRKYEYTYINIKDKKTPETPPEKVEEESPVTTVKTNINCAAGKKKIENILARQDGVRSAIVDIKTGDLKLVYSTDGTSYSDIIKLINEEGFDADKSRSKYADKNNHTK